MMTSTTPMNGPAEVQSKLLSGTDNDSSVNPVINRDSIVSERPLKRPRPFEKEVPLEPLEDILHRRVTVIKDGDNVLLKLPSDSVKAVVASKDGLVQLGKFGAFPASQLLGLHYDITYEIYPAGPSTSGPSTPVTDGDNSKGDTLFGQAKGKKTKKGKGKANGSNGNVPFSNQGWNNILRPLKRQPIVDAVIDDITETNELIDDTDDIKQALLSQDEIAELRAQGVSAEELIQKQMERHERFGLKTDFSKEKWRRRKEKKFYQTVHPLSPSIPNLIDHYSLRSPQSILSLRSDTVSQMLVSANIRPGGRYLVVDDTGGLITAAVIERMGCDGRVMVFTESDSPPAWGVLGVMNFGERELSCIKWLNWMEAEEDYERPPPPTEDEMPAIAAAKTAARLRKHNLQVAELNSTRDELHTGIWDGLIMATELSPMSIVARLTPYLAGSATITIYSPYLQVLVDVLQLARKDANYLNSSITESWTRTYQVLPGRTHPTMSTSATGGYLFHATRVHPSAYQPESHQRHRRRKPKQSAGKEVAAGSGSEMGADDVMDSAPIDEDGPGVFEGDVASTIKVCQELKSFSG